MRRFGATYACARRSSHGAFGVKPVVFTGSDVPTSSHASIVTDVAERRFGAIDGRESDLQAFGRPKPDVVPATISRQAPFRAACLQGQPED